MRRQHRISRRSFLIGLGGLAAVGAAGGYQVWKQKYPMMMVGFADLKELLLDKFQPTLRLAEPNVLDQAEPFDVCIIGSGPAGAVLGKALVDQGFRTVMLESGLDIREGEFDARMQRLDMYRSSGPVSYPIASSRLRALGGTSTLWTGNCSRHKPIDFEAWPITYSELEPYYEQAERTLRVHLHGARTLSDYHAPRKKDLPLALSLTNLEPLSLLMQGVGITTDGTPKSQTSIVDRGPVRAIPTLLPGFTDSPQAMLIPKLTTTRLIPDTVGRIVGAEVKNLDGQSWTVRARTYVVACGAVESARLLLLSSSPEFPHGIGNGTDQVGRYFMEHPGIGFEGKVPGMRSLFQYEILRGHQFYETFKLRGVGGVILRFMRSSKQPEMLGISGLIEMEPSATNRVTLAADVKDYFGNPGTDLFLHFSEVDLATFDQLRALIRKIYADLGAINVEEESRMHWSHHHMSTCRMGNDPKTSVTDRHLRVHESPNLYVAGSGVFATSGAGHPTLALTALSHRLADHLIATLRT